MLRIICCMFIVSVLSSCSEFQPLQFEKTYAEQQAGYSYIPLEPSTVKIHCAFNDGLGNNCNQVSKRTLLDALPDNSVRIATRLITGKASADIPVFGTDIGLEGNTYEIIMDFINTQTVNKRFLGKWYVTVPDTVKKLHRCYPYEKSVLEVSAPERYEIWTLRARIIDIEDYLKEDSYQLQVSEFRTIEKARPEYRDELVLRCPDEYVPSTYEDIEISPEVFNIPVYIGIGLRLKANVTVLKGEVNLSSLPALSTAVAAGQATGTMSVQAIGISGKAARSNLLLLDKIDETTIHNAIQVLASIKASIESEDTTITPRIVGFHNTIGAGTQGVNLIHSLLASDPNTMLILDPAAYAKGAVTDDSNTGQPDGMNEDATGDSSGTSNPPGDEVE